jgi:hypothetical protein
VTIGEIHLRLDYAAAVADWFLDIGDSCILRGDFEEALQCNHIAARVLLNQNRDLSSPRIESNLQFFGRMLPEREKPPLVRSTETEGREIWLHVLNEALPFGGHTAMATNWMQDDRSKRIHSVALLSQTLPVPHELVQAVRKSGGNVYPADSTQSFLSRATWLRRLAYELASFVVLHVDLDDVISPVAFGGDGGPPVLMVNHAAHIFWIGGSIADLVVNCRGSVQEESWTHLHRGIPRYATIPIPLLKPTGSNAGTFVNTRKREEARENIGIPKDSVCILTIGDSFKYTPIDALNFIEVCEDILRDAPDAFLVAVGPEADGCWKIARDRFGSRLRVYGRQSRTQIAVFHQAADIYIEGFPFGSTTALLEAGIRGIPVVLAPAECPPPYGSDGVALDEVLVRPSSIDEYKTMVVRLSKSSIERDRWGSRVCSAVTRHHTGSGWGQYLENAIRKLPSAHVAYPVTSSVRTPGRLYGYWTRFRSKVSGTHWGTLFENFVMYAFSMGVRPRLTTAILKACVDARTIRTHRTIPLPLVMFLCNGLFPLLPLAWARRIFRLFGIFCGTFPAPTLVPARLLSLSLLRKCFAGYDRAARKQ